MQNSESENLFSGKRKENIMLTLQVSPGDVYQLVNQLDIEDKIKIFQNLKPVVISDHWDRFLKRIDVRLKKYPITEEEIEKETESAREEIASYRSRYQCSDKFLNR